MSRVPDELALLAEIADLIEQGCETPYRKAERIVQRVRWHDEKALRAALSRLRSEGPAA